MKTNADLFSLKQEGRMSSNVVISTVEAKTHLFY